MRYRNIKYSPKNKKTKPLTEEERDKIEELILIRLNNSIKNDNIELFKLYDKKILKILYHNLGINYIHDIFRLIFSYNSYKCFHHIMKLFKNNGITFSVFIPSNMLDYYNMMIKNELLLNKISKLKERM